MYILEKRRGLPLKKVVIAFSPLVQDTVLKGTFNATLNNPIAPQLDMSQHMGTSTKHAFLLGV
uniref:Uncharacterized protein n=1 Tax=Magallana gigas TaxID=29159 RepID=K1R6T0_MAGGI